MRNLFFLNPSSLPRGLACAFAPRGSLLCRSALGTLHSQSRTQSPQASWSAGGRRERLWGNGIGTDEILRLTVLSFVTLNGQKQAIEKRDHPPTKRPGDSGTRLLHSIFFARPILSLKKNNNYSKSLKSLKKLTNQTNFHHRQWTLFKISISTIFWSVGT